MDMRVLADFQAFRRMPGVYGIERAFVTSILFLRCLSLGYWIRTRLPAAGGPDRRSRDQIIDVYCLGQAILLVMLLFRAPSSLLSLTLASYILFEIFLAVTNIIFVGKFEALQATPASIERSVLLLFLNLAEVVVVFAIFYAYALGISPRAAVFQSALVLGTINYPAVTGNAKALVVMQIVLDLVLSLLLLSSFASQVELFARCRSVKPRGERMSADCIPESDDLMGSPRDRHSGDD